jgi:hypothetical protein
MTTFTAWSDPYRHNTLIALNAAGAQSLSRLSEYADQLADGHEPEVTAAQIIRDTLQGAVIGKH